MKITVEKKKKSVVVLDWGHGPFYVQEKHNRRVYIPDGFTVETFCFTKLWVAQTSVQGDSLQYQFFLKADPTKTSGWQKSASAALQVANERIKNKNYKAGTNGALVVGVTYPSLQEEIMRRFGSQLDAKAPASSHSSRGSSRQEQPQPAFQHEPCESQDEPEQEGPATQPIEDDGDMDEVDEYTGYATKFDKDDEGCMFLGKAFQMDEDMSAPQALEPISLEPVKEDMLREYSINADVREMDTWFDVACMAKQKSAMKKRSLYQDDFRPTSFEETEDPEIFFASQEFGM